MDAPSSLTTPHFAAIVVAAGKGLRAGGKVPKQFVNWRGKPLLRHSVESLLAAGAAPVVIVIPEGGIDVAQGALAGLRPVHFVTGGATRQQSVRAGLEALVQHNPAHVLIHDAARPVVPSHVVERLTTALQTARAAIPVLPVVDSIAVAEAGRMSGKAERDQLRRVQTPQAFLFTDILEAHRVWSGAGDAGDDAQVAHAAGIAVTLVDGDEAMRKITFAEDLMNQPAPVRSGTGFDVHRLAEGEELWLCGVKIDHPMGLAGHSDADVAIHALVDALLGAIGNGDIGSHFPPSDPQWKGASSDRFLAHAASLVSEAGYAIGNVDVTIICEAPKVGPYRDAMKACLARIMGVDIAAVSVKATTTERLGFTGRSEGIVAQAIATLYRQD